MMNHSSIRFADAARCAQFEIAVGKNVRKVGADFALGRYEDRARRARQRNAGRQPSRQCAAASRRIVTDLELGIV